MYEEIYFSISRNSYESKFAELVSWTLKWTSLIISRTFPIAQWLNNGFFSNARILKISRTVNAKFQNIITINQRNYNLTKLTDRALSNHVNSITLSPKLTLQIHFHWFTKLFMVQIAILPLWSMEASAEPALFHTKSVITSPNLWWFSTRSKIEKWSLFVKDQAGPLESGILHGLKVPMHGEKRENLVSKLSIECGDHAIIFCVDHAIRLFKVK